MGPQFEVTPEKYLPCGKYRARFGNDAFMRALAEPRFEDSSLKSSAKASIKVGTRSSESIKAHAACTAHGFSSAKQAPAQIKAEAIDYVENGKISALAMGRSSRSIHRHLEHTSSRLLMSDRDAGKAGNGWSFVN